MLKEKGQLGLALLAVLWMVAALSVIVIGLTSSVRNELRLVSSARDAIVARAIGTAAINIALQSMLAREDRPASLQLVNTEFANQRITVKVMPLNGLVDINNAPPALLARLLSVASGLGADTAQQISQAIVSFRDTKDATGERVGFAAPEDLMRVPGFGYDLYAQVAPLVTADLQGSGKVSVAAADADVLTVLADGNREQAIRISAQRMAGLVGVDTTALTSEFIDSGASTRYRLEARVPLSAQAELLCIQTVDLDPGVANKSPWRILRSEYRTVAVQIAAR